MKAKKIILTTFLSMLCSGVILGCNVLPSSAAEAVPPPVAKKAPQAQPPVAKKTVKASTKVAPRQNASHLTTIERSGPKTPVAKQASPAPKQTPGVAAATPDPNDPVKNALDTFAKKCIVDMNKSVKTNVKKLPDGTYAAIYWSYDGAAMETSYRPTANNKTIKYIGRMNYIETEFLCVGKTQKEALAGPYTEVVRVPVTEIVKHKAGKWTR